MVPSPRNYWPYYIVISAIFAALVWLGLFVFQSLTDAENSSATQTSAPIVLYFGVVIAFVSILASSLSQWRNLRVQHTFQALQTLRTDREYLINAMVAEAQITGWGIELTDYQISGFKSKRLGGTVDKPTFSQASRFMLNQYEFIAAGCRQGLLDEKLLRMTLRSVFCNIVMTYRPLIEERRTDYPDSLANLVWMYRRFSGDLDLELGPPLPVSDGLAKRAGKFLGVVRQSA